MHVKNRHVEALLGHASIHIIFTCQVGLSMSCHASHIVRYNAVTFYHTTAFGKNIFLRFFLVFFDCALQICWIQVMVLLRNSKVFHFAAKFGRTNICLSRKEPHIHRGFRSFGFGYGRFIENRPITWLVHQYPLQKQCHHFDIFARGFSILQICWGKSVNNYITTFFVVTLQRFLAARSSKTQFVIFFYSKMGSAL